ncbi:MAG: sulfite exporter TauE/SafE family protein [Chloroflexi bacterium]|nr:sulfite exporter TauE/SafE family protein [Chloroflexota bacterium]
MLWLTALMALAPGTVLAHPLGNFTINLYDGLTMSADGAVIDHVLDMAEIPAFQERQRMDTDGDSAVSDGEAARWAGDTCRETASDLTLTVGGERSELQPTALGLSFPPGQGGLVTLRLVCTYEAAFAPVSGATDVTFEDSAYAERLGWREIVVNADGVQLSGAEAFAQGTSERLTAYPEAQLGQPRDQASAAFSIAPGGAAVPLPPAPDAVPVGSSPGQVMNALPGSGAVPGGIAELPPEISEIIQARDLSLPAIALSLLVAAGVGAVHAASPGHGKTLMAAYLVGTRGTMRHAMGLGLTVTVSHTIGVFALGGIILFAGSFVPPERLFPILGLVSGSVVVVIGVALLAQLVRDERRRRAAHQAEHDHAPGDGHDHHHGEGQAHQSGHDGAHDHAHDDGHPHDHDHDHDHEERAPAPTSPDDDAVGGWHSHGLVRHTHLPQGGDPLRWRNLFALGLVGGLVPSASAILILVGSIAAGRPAYGMVLTLAFGLGMAVVLVGVGVLLVRARGLIERWPRSDRLAPLLSRLPILTAVVFVIVGVAISAQAASELA